MTIQNVSKTPKLWSESELKIEAQKALEGFVDRRLSEPGETYVHYVQSRRRSIAKLFKVLAEIDPDRPDPSIVRKILLTSELFDALRYVAGPPISKDDLGVLVTRRIESFNRTEIKKSDQLTVDILKLICRLADPCRFPWIVDRRVPSARELRIAIQTTAILHASQSLQTDRRGYGKKVEQRLEEQLKALGFEKTRTPSKAKIIDPIHYPKYPHFYGECTVHGRKVDLFIALPNGRMIALEAKDSSSGLNSVKRLNNDTAAKAKHFSYEGGKNILNVALLSGVFKLSSLISAQDSGLYLIWSHDLGDFVEWVKSQT